MATSFQYVKKSSGYLDLVVTYNISMLISIEMTTLLAVD